VADLRWGATTDPGRIRPDNEDNLLAEPNVFAVADGMGGHRAGEVASALAVDLLRSRLSAPGADLEQVVAAVAEVNGDIYRAAIGNPDQQGMGTTVTALAVIAVAPEPDGGAADVAPADETSTPPPQQQLALVNVGDSRTYLLRHGRLRRVTVDHSYVQELVATGHITDDEARTHPRRNIVTRALGIDPAVRVDAWTLPLVRGDRFLLCSDGLVDEVRDDEIVSVLQTVTEPQAAADELVALANRQGGRDNISVIVVDVLEGADPPDADTELDLEPAWDDAGGSATWAIDEPEAEATTFDDLAALVSGDQPSAEAVTDPTMAAPVVTADEVTVDGEPAAPKRRKRRLIGFFAGLGVLAVLVLALVIAGAWARRSFFVAFNDDDTVVIYRGRKDGFLWFDPTVQNLTVVQKDQLDAPSISRVEQRPVFDSAAAAAEFVDDQLETTTTTSTTTTTTTTTTTVPATTTTVAATTTTAG
jgi:serine/threonine protein phosphatase PrpC